MDTLYSIGHRPKRSFCVYPQSSTRRVSLDWSIFAGLSHLELGSILSVTHCDRMWVYSASEIVTHVHRMQSFQLVPV
jgi:hypothetical protein